MFPSFLPSPASLSPGLLPIWDTLPPLPLFLQYGRALPLHLDLLTPSRSVLFSCAFNPVCALMIHRSLSFLPSCKPFSLQNLPSSSGYATKLSVSTQDSTSVPANMALLRFISLSGCSALKLEIPSLFLLILPIVHLLAPWIAAPVFLLPAEILPSHGDCLFWP